jgi:hypothetical protein
MDMRTNGHDVHTYVHFLLFIQRIRTRPLRQTNQDPSDPSYLRQRRGVVAFSLAQLARVDAEPCA